MSQVWLLLSGVLLFDESRWVLTKPDSARSASSSFPDGWGRNSPSSSFRDTLLKSLPCHWALASPLASAPKLGKGGPIHQSMPFPPDIHSCWAQVSTWRCPVGSLPASLNSPTPLWITHPAPILPTSVNRLIWSCLQLWIPAAVFPDSNLLLIKANVL